MYKELFQKDLENYFKTKDYSLPIVVNYSDYEDFHYQTPILFALKKKEPDFKPEELITYLKSTGNYEKIEITGNGFISLKCHLKTLEEHLSTKQTILVDYCGVNVAKQMHIGHIRSMFIGDFIVRLHENMGDKVVIHNHVGDWGNQFGFLLNYIQEQGFEDKTLSNKELTELYKQAYNKYKEDTQFAQQSDKVASLLQNKDDKNIYQLWQKLVNTSLLEADKIFKEFNLKISLNDTRGESFYAPYCQDVLNDLIQKGIAIKDPEGSVVVFFDDKSPLVLQKSNGNLLYAIYDITAVKWRVENINPDKIVYVVDKRQALHFEQVFEVAKKAGYVSQKTQLLHVGFGTILGKDKKPLKTKEGEALYLDVLLEEGKNILAQDKHFIEMNQEFKQDILNKSIVGGMKYYDLKFNKQQDYIFDWEHVLNFTGGSAPYIQNAFVRIDSILFKKYGENQTEEFNWNNEWSDLEKNIIFQCQKLKEMLPEIKESYASQLFTAHMIKVCQYFHKYYESEKILGHENENQKLQLIKLVKDTLNYGAEIIGIELYPCEQKLLNKIPKITMK